MNMMVVVGPWLWGVGRSVFFKKVDRARRNQTGIDTTYQNQPRSRVELDVKTPPGIEQVRSDETQK